MSVHKIEYLTTRTNNMLTQRIVPVDSQQHIDAGLLIEADVRIGY